MRETALDYFEPNRTIFESEMDVRPDDIDMFQHVHASKYQDYILAARFDQMKRCYGISMEAFMEKGLGWFVRDFCIEYKRSLGLGDRFKVKTWIQDFFRTGVCVHFEIIRKTTDKLCCKGKSHYTMVSLTTQRPEPIPGWVLEKYRI
ncbi:MAG: acyl-CoA thioesterase [Verrucomicrobia bacterium]|jgi:acyl-CoA thioester hydrolase/thioesterase-3|nr:acyl-CoA thioesterase [Verrucomicrobiota bacterium]MBT4273472.1 acyl-CoA thioesterase [Verrucomicrobiota bacterium]MBT5061466.1 acyl-CoA thioesterase [Verrucomicrobiota bacterium]MBT5479378.1 acyl-CoA thioesterase [Verrucomicrobiota bacterium]MBT6239689.1 acyl-CoA thioesterase [Verrucomicrobiota bacterium]